MQIWDSLMAKIVKIAGLETLKLINLTPKFYSVLPKIAEYQKVYPKSCFSLQNSILFYNFSVWIWVSISVNHWTPVWNLVTLPTQTTWRQQQTSVEIVWWKIPGLVDRSRNLEVKSGLVWFPQAKFFIAIIMQFDLKSIQYCT